MATSQPKTCTKCGSTRFNSHNRCMDCRNDRGKKRRERIKAAGGSHTEAQWLAVVARTPSCPDCKRTWADIPFPRNALFKNVWTRDHIVPIYHGGNNDISNIRALCYQCNFRKNAGPLGPRRPRPQEGVL